MKDWLDKLIESPDWTQTPPKGYFCADDLVKQKRYNTSCQASRTLKQLWKDDKVVRVRIIKRGKTGKPFATYYYGPK